MISINDNKSIEEQAARLADGADIIIATPALLKQFDTRGRILLEDVVFWGVLGADELLADQALERLVA